MNDFSEMYDLKRLKAHIPRAVEEIEQLTCDNCPEPHPGEVMYTLDCISPGWMGHNQPEDIVLAFDLDINPDDDWVWEHIQEAESDLTMQAQQEINGVLPDDLGIGFGNVPWNGDYGLLLWYVEA